MSERLLTPAEVAAWAHVSERTIRRAIARGDLRAGRAGDQLRIDPVDARAWVFGDSSSGEGAANVHAFTPTREVRRDR